MILNGCPTAQNNWFVCLFPFESEPVHLKRVLGIKHLMKFTRSLKAFALPAFLVVSIDCTNPSKDRGNDRPTVGNGDSTKNTSAGTCSRYYSFEGKFYDLETLKQVPAGPNPADFKNCSTYGYQFQSPLNDTVIYMGKTFFVGRKTYQLFIQENGKQVAVKMPVADPLPEVHEYYFTLLTVSDGVVVIMEDYYGTGFTILKYDENGKELARTGFEHTFVTHPEPSTNYMHRYLYLGHTTPTQLIFTSHMAFGEKDKTIVVELSDLSKKAYDYKIAGIVSDESQQKAKGFVVNKGDGKFTVKFPETGKEINFNIGYGDGACTVILKNKKLIVANYHPISTGSSLQCFDAGTGNMIWKADVVQVNASHSEYYNTVYLSLYKNKIVMEGHEAYGKYLQLFDLDTGKRLACFGIPVSK